MRTMAASTPQPSPEKSYRVISVSLYADQAELVDHATDTLLSAGFAKANRSLVIQTAIQRLREDLEGKSPEETISYFTERQMRRPLAAAVSRARQTSVETRRGHAGRRA
jgi:hypothetical protein